MRLARASRKAATTSPQSGQGSVDEGDITSADPAIARNMPGGMYEITQELPKRDGEYEYRIKSINEPHERIMREIELLIISRSDCHNHRGRATAYTCLPNLRQRCA